MSNICLAAIGVLLTGCGENDQEYYRKNIDKATSKLEQCEKDMEAAIMTQNTSEFKKIQNDKECDYAKQAIKEDKIAQKKAAEEAKKADIQRLTNDLTQKYKDNSWNVNVNIYNKETKQNCDTYSFDKSNECVAWDQFYEEQRQIGENKFNELSFPELVALETKYCENKMFHESKSNCTIWRQTKDNKEKEVIQSYIDDSKKLESEFNLCVEKIRGLD